MKILKLIILFFLLSISFIFTITIIESKYNHKSIIKINKTNTNSKIIDSEISTTDYINVNFDVFNKINKEGLNPNDHFIVFSVNKKLIKIDELDNSCDIIKKICSLRLTDNDYYYFLFPKTWLGLKNGFYGKITPQIKYRSDEIKSVILKLDVVECMSNKCEPENLFVVSPNLYGILNYENFISYKIEDMNKRIGLRLIDKKLNTSSSGEYIQISPTKINNNTKLSVNFKYSNGDDLSEIYIDYKLKDKKEIMHLVIDSYNYYKKK